MTKNECGSCSACCELLGVVELQKSNWRKCSFQKKEGGCRVYGCRPQSCREIECYWLQGLLPEGEEYRPDRLGLMFWGLHVIDRITGAKKFMVGAWKTDDRPISNPARDLLDRITKKGWVVVVISYGGAEPHYVWNRPELLVEIPKS